MAETLAFLARLLVVRYLARVVVQPETMARCNAGARYVALYLMRTLERAGDEASA